VVPEPTLAGGIGGTKTATYVFSSRLMILSISHLGKT